MLNRQTIETEHSSIGLSNHRTLSPNLLKCTRYPFFFYLHRRRQHDSQANRELSYLGVEETGVLLDKGDAQLLGRLKDGLVVLAAQRGCDVLGTRTSSPVDVVGEGELQ